MPNGFLPTDLPSYLACRSDFDAASLPSAGGGFAKPTRSKRSAQTREQTSLRAPPGQTSLRSARKESSSFGLGRGFGPGWRVGSPPWRIRLARPDPRFASSGGEEERNGAETWKRRLSDFVGSAAGPSERRGEVGAGEKSREKKERKNTLGRMGRRGKKTEDQVRRFAAPGDKKRSHAASFFLHFASAPRGA